MGGMRSLGFLLLACLAVLPAGGRVITVPIDEPDIMTAMRNAVRGDTLLVGSGMYRENILFRSGVWMQSIAGPGRTILRGAEGRPVVHVPGQLTREQR